MKGVRVRLAQASTAALTLGLAAVTGRAGAGPTAAPPSRTGSLAGGAGLSAVSVRVDTTAKKLFVRSCAGLPCEPGSEGVAIDLSDPLDLAKARFDTVDIGNGRKLLRVIVPSASRPGVAFEALLAGRETPVLFAGATGFGGTGEGAGQRIVIEGNTVFVGKLRRELTVCGMNETLLEPRRLDPKTLELRRVAMHRLAADVRKAAPALVATKAESAPVASLLSVRGASVHDGASLALADGDDATAWTETLKGDGKGEFVVFSAPKQMPIARLSLLLAGSFTAPTSLFLSVDDGTYRISIPAGSGPRVDVPLPAPLKTSCLAISLDAEGGDDPTIGLAEVDAAPVLPTTVKTLDDLVTLLDQKGESGDLAQTLLDNAGARGAKAIHKRLAALGDLGRERVIELLDGAPCEAASYPLATLAYEAPKALAAKARGILDRCGVAATAALAATYSSGTDAAREVLAERWAKVDPKNALPAILETVRKAPATRRHTFRIALGRVPLKAAGREAIATWLASKSADPSTVGPGEVDPAIELARAIAPVPELAEDPTLIPALSKVLAARASGTFEAQWLAAQPLADLAARGDAASLARIRALCKSTDRYLRARAIDVSGDLEALRPEVVSALKDPDPRVRKTALLALRRGAGPTGAVAPTMTLLHDDGWTYVRVAAAETLGESKGGADVDLALGAATLDDLPAVRAAAIRALVTRGARSQLKAIRKRAFDAGELVEVRGEAILALGKLCDRDAVDELFDIAKRGSSGDGAHQLALAAVMALGDIHPKDLAQRLSALDQSSLVMKDAIRRALKTTSLCK